MKRIAFRRPVEVIKVGGSLFDLPDLACRLHDLARGSDAAKVFLFGGGDAVERLREAYARGDVSASDAHWRALEEMTRSAKRWARLLDWPVVRTWKEIEAGLNRHAAVVAEVDGLVRAAGPELPIGWEVTSDSIAAWLAKRLAARSLVLLKSVEVEEGWSLTEWEARGVVDAHFPVIGAELLASGTTIGAINLRREPGTRARLCRVE